MWWLVVTGRGAVCSGWAAACRYGGCGGGLCWKGIIIYDRVDGGS